MTLDLDHVAQSLGGEVSSGQVLAPGPGHSATDRSLSIKLDDKAPEGFLVHSFSGDDAIACRDFVRERLGLPKPEPKKKGNGKAAKGGAWKFIREHIYRPRTARRICASKNISSPMADGNSRRRIGAADSGSIAFRRIQNPLSTARAIEGAADVARLHH